MKYITTDKHPELKEGIILEDNNPHINENWRSINTSFPYTFWKETIELWLKKGYIKEVEEKEFTKSDMIELIEFLIPNMLAPEDSHDIYMKFKQKKS